MEDKIYSLDFQETVLLGNMKQHIRVRGTNEKNPLLLFLHGGPGACNRHAVLELHSRLAHSCTLILWDQRGSGKSYGKCSQRKELNLNRLVQDAGELAEYLCNRFGQEKIYVLGHSFGSILGTLLAQRYPEHIAAYIGMAQFTNLPEHEIRSYLTVWQEAEKRGDPKVLRLLERIGKPKEGQYRTLKDLMAQRRYRSTYAGGTMHKPGVILKDILLPLLRSPEYTFLDTVRYMAGALYSVRRLWREIAAINFEDSVSQLSMPVYIFQGRHDYLAPPELAERWFDMLEAPYKEWIWFENSAHSPIDEEPELWETVIQEKLF